MNNLYMYKLVRSRIEPGDTISFRGKSIISSAIQLFSARSHIAQVCSSPVWDSECELANRKLIIEANEGEVNVRALSSKLRKYKGRAYWHRLIDDLNPYRSKLDEYVWLNIGKPYDYNSLFRNILGRVVSDTSKFFCSEIVGLAILYGIEKSVLEKYLPNKYLEMLLNNIALRPGGIAQLPIYKKEIQIL